MKKIISLILVLVLVLSLSITAFAAEVPEGESQSIKATYSVADAQEVYKVDITWGSMEFHYNSGDQMVWNPETLLFEEQTGGDPFWAPAEKGGDTVTITNHSNAAVNVSIAYTKDATNGVDGTLDNGSFTLESAVGTAVEAAPSKTATLNLSTANLPASFQEGSADVTIGAMTVTIMEAALRIDGTLGGKTVATKEDVDALMEQLKGYVDSGITTITVTGSEPAMYNLLGSDLPAVSAAIFFLGSSGSTTNGDRNSPYCGTIDLIMPDATSLAYMEFCSTYALNSVTLPKVTKIADQAFHDTPYLRTITFGSVLTEVNETGGVMFAQVGKEVGGCDLILNCGQMNESSVSTPDLTTNIWRFKYDNEFKSITLTHTGECDECKANQ